MKERLLKTAAGTHHIPGKQSHALCGMSVGYGVETEADWNELPDLYKCASCRKIRMKISKSEEMPSARRHAKDMEKLKAWVKAVE